MAYNLLAKNSHVDYSGNDSAEIGLLLTCPVFHPFHFAVAEKGEQYFDRCVCVCDVCTDYLEPGIAGPAHKDPTASLSLSTETMSSWMRDANVDADIHFYSRSSLLRRDEYFFRVWYYSRQLFK